MDKPRNTITTTTHTFDLDKLTFEDSVRLAREFGVEEDRIIHSADEMRNWLFGGDQKPTLKL